MFFYKKSFVEAGKVEPENQGRWSNYFNAHPLSQSSCVCEFIYMNSWWSHLSHT